ncbi:protein containing DNA/RNA helicase [gut metagenome]|uniref:Protein containing DNA/RNA helicase n=1 Tax=gut metagenome TaxID=749906 RepID=J9GJG7_9ZZZZ
MNRRGLKTLALTGADSQERRSEAIRRLTQETGGDSLDYLLTVDIFNEGVDIPEVNQVIFLRPTESAIIFVQQLGRGLRKAPGKEFVVIIDFIGNYRNNFLIPVALSGDNSYNKDRLRRFVHTDKDYLPGASTIHFDPIAERTIYRLIDAARTNDLALLRSSYAVLKRKLGRIPSLTDFDEHGEVDPVKFFDHASLGSYPAFLEKVEPALKETLTARAAKTLIFSRARSATVSARRRRFFSKRFSRDTMRGSRNALPTGFFLTTPGRLRQRISRM